MAVSRFMGLFYEVLVKMRLCPVSIKQNTIAQEKRMRLEGKKVESKLESKS